MIHPFDFQPRTRVIFGQGSFERVGEVAREQGFRRSLLVADRGMLDAGYVAESLQRLQGQGIEVCPFHDFEINPTTAMVEAGCVFAAPLQIDSIIGLGGGSSMDCAKGINFLLTNGGRMQDYWGFGKARKPMLPMIGIPTTSGTGSEAQCYALIADAVTHVKMACGDSKASFRAAILDPTLTISQPPGVTASAGYDAIAHAVETFVSTSRNPLSEAFSREAWRLLETHFETVLVQPKNLDARAGMQLGAHYAGVAIENSMLGATHACANPLTAKYGTTHGVAIAALLSTVVRWNSQVVGDRYASLLQITGRSVNPKEAGEALSSRLRELAKTAGLPVTLREVDIPGHEFTLLAEEAAQQWTGRFNPRPFDVAGALEVYQWAY